VAAVDHDGDINSDFLGRDPGRCLGSQDRNLQHRPGLAVYRGFTRVLADSGIATRMDGKGAWRDNVFVERLFRSVKYEEAYLRPMKASARRATESVAAHTRAVRQHKPTFNPALGLAA
jgi:transposase InsO family protein